MQITKGERKCSAIKFLICHKFTQQPLKNTLRIVTYFPIDLDDPSFITNYPCLPYDTANVGNPFQ